MHIHRVRGALAAAVLAAATTSVAGASTASAVPTGAAGARPNHVVSYVPLRGAERAARFDTTFKNLDYNGGPVMPSNTNYIVFWSPRGLGAYGHGAPPQYVTGLEQYFTDLAHDSGGRENVDSVATQYNDLTGAVVHYASSFGGAILDTHPYPQSECPTNGPVTHCLTDEQIQRELERVVSAHHLKRDLTHEYFMMPPPHVESCFSATPPSYDGCSAGEIPSKLAAFCAYHGNTTMSPMLMYSNDPDVLGNRFCDEKNHPNGPSDAELIGGLSHEHNESITDPMPNDAWTNGAGANHGMENGDQCVGQMGTPLGTAPNGAKYNQVINGHFYWYQEEWSNQGHTCLQRLPKVEPKPTAKFAVTGAQRRTLTFSATGSSAPGGGARYVWQFNDAFGAETVERTSPSITHTFPAAGAYSIGLTVMGGDGISTGTGAIVSTGHLAFTPGFRARSTGHHEMKFVALTRVSNQDVITYHWEFGDGSIGSVGQPTHAYAKAGTYRVKLVMFTGVGSAFPGAGAGPIYERTITVR